MAFHGYQHRPVAPPPREAWQRPVRVEPVPGTPYGLAVFGAPTATSGPAIGALVAGVVGALMSFLVMCLGLTGAGEGWGVAVAGAFAILSAFLGAGAVGLGVVGLRHTRPGAPMSGAGSAPVTSIRGRGLALAGLICGATTVGLTLLSFAAVLAVQASGA